MDPRSRLRAWTHAVRPHTLPASAAPVIVGWALAHQAGTFAPLAAGCALLGAVLIQVGTNLANDYYDAQKGVDTSRRTGFTRVTHSGLISARKVWGAMVGTFAAALVPGAYLVLRGGVPILVIGLLGIAAGFLYAGGPVPFGSIALGDPMVFVFFGPVAVGGTYYVQAIPQAVAPFPGSIPPGTLPGWVLWASLPAAALTTAILVVNNLRDRQTDREAGKMTMAVLLGPTGTRVEYVLLLGAAYLVPLGMALWGPFSVGVLLPFLSLPYAYWVARDVCREQISESLNEALSATGRLLLLHSLLFAGGLIV